jgi:hypothetical protein
VKVVQLPWVVVAAQVQAVHHLHLAVALLHLKCLLKQVLHLKLLRQKHRLRQVLHHQQELK